MTIVVTGANGHIGNNLVRALVEAGENVRAVVHTGTRALEGVAAEQVKADVLDPDSLTRAFQGAELVYHLAGHISIVPYESVRMHDINVQGTRNAVQAAIACGVGRLVYTSSIESLLHPGKGDPVDEEGPPRPELPVTVYGRTKALAELEVHAGIERGLDAVIVHPTAVVGPFDYKPSLFGQVFVDFALRRLPAFTAGVFDLVDVRDVVAGLRAAAEKGRCGEHYLLGSELISIPDLGSVLEEACGVPRPKLKIPLWMAGLAGVFMPAFYRLTGRRPRFTRMSLRMLADGRRVSHEKASSELGYRPRPPHQGVEAAVDWFRQAGMVYPVFGSRHDPGLIVLVAAVLALCSVGGVLLLVSGGTQDLLLGTAALVFSSLYAWLTIPVRYELPPGLLVVRGGPFRWRIPLDDIQEVRASRNPVGAPAWSLKRLRVDYRKKGKRRFVLISPRDREDFMRRLAEAAPFLSRSEDALIRTPPPTPPPADLDGTARRGLQQGHAKEVSMERMPSIELALKNEKTEMDFYLNEAARSRNQLAQKMFSTLAQDEQEHMQRIQGLYDKLRADGSWPQDVPIEVRGTNVREVLDGLVGRSGSARDHDDDDLAALDKAAAFEAQGAEFYADLAQACTNPMEKNFFQFLSRIEKEHHLSVTDSLAYLRDPEAWMMQHERAHFDGAP